MNFHNIIQLLLVLVLFILLGSWEDVKLIPVGHAYMHFIMCIYLIVSVALLFVKYVYEDR
jgi:hypothetical protein